MHVLLWEGNGNILFAEELVDPVAHSTFNLQAIHQRAHADPKMDFKDECAIAEVFEQHNGWWIFRHATCFGNSTSKLLSDFRRIAFVGNADFDLGATRQQTTIAKS